MDDCFRRIDEETITSDQALEQYRRVGFLWVRLSSATSPSFSSPSSLLTTLRSLFAANPKFYGRHWSVENSGGAGVDESRLAPEVIFGSSGEKKKTTTSTAAKSDIRHLRPFYVSAILQRDPSALSRFFAEALPFAGGAGQPSLLTDCTHDDGCWLFVGRTTTTAPPDEDEDEDEDDGRWRRVSAPLRVTVLSPVELIDESQGLALEFTAP